MLSVFCEAMTSQLPFFFCTTHVKIPDRGVPSARHLTALPLHKQQIQPIRLTNAECRQDCVRLATMVRLVIEQVRKDFPAALRPGSSVHRAIEPHLFQLRVREAFDVGDDPLILLLSRSRQR